MNTRSLNVVLLVCSLLVPISAAAQPDDGGYRYDDGPLFEGAPPKFVLIRPWPAPTAPDNFEYSFRNFTPDMLQGDVEISIANAFALWALACPQLEFAKIDEPPLQRSEVSFALL